MATLPKEPVLPEAAFIGRSNVGKSSLINMVCNRKVRVDRFVESGKRQKNPGQIMVLASNLGKGRLPAKAAVLVSFFFT